MNERIRELAVKAGIISSEYNGFDPTSLTSAQRTFAELIVRECCDWIDGSPATDAGQLLLTKSFIIANLKEHFGVE